MKKKAGILIIVGIVFIGFGLTLNNINTKQVDNDTQYAKEIENQKIYNEFIKNKFSLKYFTIRKLNISDKQFFDLQIEYNIKGETGRFYIQTEWIKENDNKFIVIKNNKSYMQNNSEQSFIVVGIEGKPNKPELLYIIPANKINTNKIYFGEIDKFEKQKINSNFYFDTKTKLLK